MKQKECLQKQEHVSQREAEQTRGEEIWNKCREIWQHLWVPRVPLANSWRRQAKRDPQSSSVHYSRLSVYFLCMLNYLLPKCLEIKTEFIFHHIEYFKMLSL